MENKTIVIYHRGSEFKKTLLFEAGGEVLSIGPTQNDGYLLEIKKDKVEWLRPINHIDEREIWPSSGVLLEQPLDILYKKDPATFELYLNKATRAEMDLKRTLVYQLLSATYIAYYFPKDWRRLKERLDNKTYPYEDIMTLCKFDPGWQKYFLHYLKSHAFEQTYTSIWNLFQDKPDSPIKKEMESFLLNHIEKVPA